MHNHADNPTRRPVKAKKARFRYIAKPAPDERFWMELHHIHTALRDLDKARADLATAHAILQRVIAGADKETRKQFEKFMMRGGVTSQQFADMIEGMFKGTPTRQRKHLRIVSSNGKQRQGVEFNTLDDDLPPAA